MSYMDSICQTCGQPAHDFCKFVDPVDAAERAVIEALDMQALEAAIHCVDKMYVPSLNKLIDAVAALQELEKP